MYPKVFTAFAEAKRRYGPVAALPTRVYFYGMEPGQEINVEIERGKTSVITLTAIGRTEEDGSVRVFFELNGQPRIITVADRKANAGKAARGMADASNENHIAAAPMPGVVAMVAIAQGQAVKAGDLLITLEAMKIETAISVPKEATISEIAAKTGQPIDAKKLLVVLD